MNHFEQLVSEWLEFNGYFVRRNILVGKLEAGGYAGELDVVGFHPETRHLVHAEPSVETFSWEKREKRNRKKFELGSKYIPELLSGVGSLPEFLGISYDVTPVK